MAQGIYGDVTRELHAAWVRRAQNGSPVVSRQEIRSLFNDIGLFPSESQVFEMLQCSKDRNSLAFGEFCVFATELRRNSEVATAAAAAANSSSSSKINPPPPPPLPPPPASKHKKKIASQKSSSSSSSSSSSYDVFLGGSCNPTTWRADIVIPGLKSHAITYYNPQQANWSPELIELEHQAKQSSQILFYVVNPMTRNVVSMIEIANFCGADRRLIATINHYPKKGHKVNDDVLSEAELEDLNAALTTVHDIIERQGLPVFDDINVALTCTSKVIKDNVRIEDLGLKDSVFPVKMAHVKVGDKLVRLREAFDALDSARVGKITLTDVRMAFRIHAHRDLRQQDLRQILSAHDYNAKKKYDQVIIDFNHFCCIVSEFKNSRNVNGNGNNNDDEEANCGTNIVSKTSHFCQTLTAPISRFVTYLANISNNTNNNNSSSLSSSSSSSSSTSSPPLRYSRSRRGSSIRDVYLGGSLYDPSNWREILAIPLLKKSGLTFFNSNSSVRSRRLTPIEIAAMDNSRLLLFVILGTSRSVSEMCEAAYYIGQGCNVVLCVRLISEDGEIDGEPLTRSALKDYNRGRQYLSDIANREGVPVFEEINEALECVIQKCKTK